MKKIISLIFTLFISMQNIYAQEIKFDNETYKLKFSGISNVTKGYGNEYFRGSEDVSNWLKMIGIYHYPTENNPLKYAENFDKTIEQTDNCLFLKMIENKNTSKAVLSFLTNGRQNSKDYFEYDVYKFEKNPQKGMTVSKYASRHYFTNNNEIAKIAEQIKKDNDKFLELFVISQTPAVIEK